MRALRCDKLTLGVLEHTLRLFLQPEALPQRHEVLRSMTEELRFVHERAQRLQVEVQRSCNAWLVAEVVRSESEAGSGALPLEKIPSHAVRLRAVACSSSALARLLRLQELPVLAYVREACVWLDCRTILEREIPLVVQALQTAGRILAEPGSRRAKK